MGWHWDEVGPKPYADPSSSGSPNFILYQHIHFLFMYLETLEISFKTKFILAFFHPLSLECFQIAHPRSNSILLPPLSLNSEASHFANYFSFPGGDLDLRIMITFLS